MQGRATLPDHVVAECLAQEVDVIDEKTQAALSQIGREEKAAAADEVSPIVRHRPSIARQKAMGFVEPVTGPATLGRTRWLNPSYGLKCRRNKAMGFTPFNPSYALAVFVDATLAR
jgi:hypothetical protein